MLEVPLFIVSVIIICYLLREYIVSIGEMLLEHRKVLAAIVVIIIGTAYVIVFPAPQAYIADRNDASVHFHNATVNSTLNVTSNITIDSTPNNRQSNSVNWPWFSRVQKLFSSG